MGFQRDLALEQLELVHKSAVSHQLARYALALRYEMLPEQVVHQAKRCLLDALGCVIGAYEAPGRVICEAVAREIGGPEEATVVGSGLRTSALNTTLVNSFAVRFLDYNDHGGGGHNSDSIPAIIAVAEREKRNGRDVLVSLVASYEVGARVQESFAAGHFHAGALAKTGFGGDIRGMLSMPPVLGRLMGLSEDQIANAIGCLASGNFTMNILDANREEFAMRKNLRFGAISHAAILYCMLARKGFTGPIRIVEGDGGWRASLGEMDLERLVDFSGWRTNDVWFKSIPMNGTTSGHVLATLGIVRENDLKVEDIKSVRIIASRREARHCTTFAKKYPRNAESADHSAFFLNALAIKERAVGPDSIDPRRFEDPVILDLIEKITVEGDDDPRDSHSEGTSEITTKDGRKLTKHTVWPHGYGDSPMSDQELEDKFEEMARVHMGKDQVRKLIDAIWNVDRLDSMDPVMRLTTFPSR